MNSDYTIQNGRLVNNAQPLESGISQASRLKKNRERAEKVRMIAEGNELAKANIDLFKKL